MTTGRIRYVALDVLDKQMLDTDGQNVGRVDDVEFDDNGEVITLLTGPQALADRLGGLLGSWLAVLAHGISRRSTAEPARVRVELVADFGPVITVSRSREELNAELNEDRFRDYVIGRIPGAWRESQ